MDIPYFRARALRPLALTLGACLVAAAAAALWSARVGRPSVPAAGPDPG